MSVAEPAIRASQLDGGLQIPLMKTPTSVHTARRGEVKEIGWLSAVCGVGFLIVEAVIPALRWVHHQIQASSPWLEPALAIALLGVAAWVGLAWWGNRNPPTADPSLDQPVAPSVQGQVAVVEAPTQVAPPSQPDLPPAAVPPKPKWRTASELDIYEG